MAMRLHLKIPVIGRLCQYLHFALCVGFHDCSFPHTYINIYTLSIFAFTRNVGIHNWSFLSISIQSVGTDSRYTVHFHQSQKYLFSLSMSVLTLHFFAFLVYHEIKIWSISNFVATQLCKPSPGLKHVSVLHMSNTVPTFFW